jgi:hypothetical protein
LRCDVLKLPCEDKRIPCGVRRSAGHVS